MVLGKEREAAASAVPQREDVETLPTYEAEATSTTPPVPAPPSQSTPTGDEARPGAAETLPAYEVESSGPSTSTPAVSAAGPPRPPGAPDALGPSVDQPFNFPSDAPVPPYTPRSNEGTRPIIAIPQVKSDTPSPFLSAYPPRLQAFGIIPETWLAFLDTLSAFLMAKVSDRALAHAADIGRHVGEGPKTRAKDVVNHTKKIGKGIGRNAKRGNIIGAAMGVIGGAVSIPITAAVHTVDAILSLPFSAASAAVKTPKTPRERADAYLSVANKEWFGARGLRAGIMDSNEVAELVEVPVVTLLSSDAARKATTAEEQLRTLEGRIADLEVWGTSQAVRLDIKGESLWVVLTEAEREIAEKP